MYGYIYLTTDTLTNKIYIGQKKSNKFLGNRYLGSGTLLSRVIESAEDKSRFVVQMIDTAETQEELDAKEIFWIEEKQSRNPSIGYNLSLGGSTNAGFKQTSNQKKIVSDYMKNRHVTEETRKNMSDSALKRVDNRVTNNGQEWVTDGLIETMILPEEFAQYASEGFAYGKLPKSEEEKQKLKNKYAVSEYIVKDNSCILVPKADLEDYFSKGWKLGRNCYSETRNANVSKGKQGTIKIVHIQTGKVKYIQPTRLNEFEEQGYLINEEYKKITQ